MTETNSQVSILFVCMGNICRSPTGEGVFRHYVDQAGMTEVIHIDSAGTIGYHSGDPADPRMCEAAARRGYVLDSIARQVTRTDISVQDLIVAMDRTNLRDLERLAGGARSHIRMLGCFLGDGCTNDLARPVPDPYYGGTAGFDFVLDMIESACPSLLEHCLELHHNKTP
jgi:protein-tyrosine phosphatase